MSLFCRHNRFTADCPICSKGTVLDPERPSGRSKPARAAGTRKRSAGGERAAAPAFSGPHVAAPPRADDDGVLSVMRLEKVPGGVRLGQWHGSALCRRAPVLPAAELADLVARAGEALPARDAERLGAALAQAPVQRDGLPVGVSRGRSGDFEEQLRVERLDDGRLRVGRWVRRPTVGWELQDAAPMLPASRYAEALADAARRGVLADALPAASS